MLHDFARAGIVRIVKGSTVTSGESIKSIICDEYMSVAMSGLNVLGSWAAASTNTPP